MANNGYLLNGVCTSDVAKVSYSVCPAGTAYTATYAKSSGLYDVACFNSSWVRFNISPIPQFPAMSCEIEGAPLTEVQQIEAINGLVPHAVAILAIAWGLRYIRVLVAEWLKERNASD